MNSNAANAFNLLASQHKVELTPIVLNKTPELRVVTEESLAETQSLPNLRLIVAEETQAIEDSMAAQTTVNIRALVKEPVVAQPSVYEQPWMYEQNLLLEQPVMNEYAVPAEQTYGGMEFGWHEGLVGYRQQITQPLYQVHTGEARLKPVVPSASELRELLIKYLGAHYGDARIVVEEKTHKLFNSLRGIMIDYNCEQRARRRWFKVGYGRDNYARVQPSAITLLENARCRWGS